MKLWTKTAPVRLPAEDYRQLCRQILERDSWRCQGCGSRANLEIHHLRFRSHQGQDAEENLITLCADCHRRSHGILAQRISEG